MARGAQPSETHALRPHTEGLIMSTLRSASDAFLSPQAPPPADAPPPAYGVAAALCAAGFAENAYLTASKLSGTAPALCSAAGAGCAAALGSTYAQLLGAPLSAFGAAAYAGVGALALRGALAGPGADSPAAAWAQQPRWALLAGATTLLSVSGYLMAVLAGPLGGQACPYCLASAALSASAFAAAARGFTAAELRAPPASARRAPQRRSG